MRIIHLLGVAIEQGVSNELLIQSDRDSNCGLAWITRSSGVHEPSVNILAGPEQLTINPHEIEMFGWAQEPVINDRRNISRRKVPQTSYPVRSFYGPECRHLSPLHHITISRVF